MDQQPDLDSLQRRGELVAGRYLIGDVIGVGGMGVVYAAIQRSLDRAVALKLPRPELVADSSVRRQFRNEALAGSRVEHRNVVRVLDYGDDREMPYLVMEHVIGLGLAQLVLEQGPLTIATAIHLVAGILAGLQQAHAVGIVHADVKCDNVLVETPRDGMWVPRIIDFGIARNIGDPVEVVEAKVSGTPEYLAPEVIRGAPPTVASDVYAAGVILYHLISGATPFAGGSSADVMVRQLELEPVPLSWRCPMAGIPPALDELVTRALAKQPSERFGDAAAFRRALAAIPHGPGRVVRPDHSSGATMFTMEETTATMSAPPLRAKSSQPDPRSRLERLRTAVAHAVAQGETHAIVVAHLDLARAHVDHHELGAATSTLERGVELLAAAPSGPSWRLLLTLAALYDGRGDRARAYLTTRTALDHAVRTGSTVGRQRADDLLARLERRRATARPPW